MKLSFPELFAKIDKAKTAPEKIALLRNNDGVVIRQLLWLAFDSGAKWLLPEGSPPFKKELDIPAGMSPSNLFLETKRMYIWVESNKTPFDLPQARREHLFIQFLEGIHWTEADLILAIKDKKFNEVYKTITDDLVREAFPGLLSPKPEPEKKPRSRAKKIKEVVKKIPLE